MAKPIKSNTKPKSLSEKKPSPDRFMPALSSFLSGKLARRFVIGLVVVVVVAGYWLLPISGQLLFVPGSDQSYQGVWPQVRITPLAAKPGDEVTLNVEDTTEWSGVKLYLNETIEAAQVTGPTQTANGHYSWQWSYKVPAAAYRAVLYHDCQSGCIEAASFNLGGNSSADLSNPASGATNANTNLKPTKLGLVFADEKRDWHNRAGWDVELLYLRQPNNSDFGLDIPK